MTATWTAPRTWADDELVNADLLNTHLRNNLEFLKTPPTGLAILNESSDFTTTSTSWADIDGAGSQLQQTIDTSGGDVLVGFSGLLGNASATNNGALDVDIDGTRLTARNSGPGDALAIVKLSLIAPISFVALVRNLSAGSHTFKMQWKSGHAVNGLTMYVSGAYKANYQFWVREVS